MKKIYMILVMFASLNLTSNAQINIDIRKVPFSCFGSTLVLSAIDRVEKNQYQLHLYDVSGDKIWQWNGLFRFELINLKGEPVKCNFSATPEMLSMKSSDGEVNICFENPVTLRFRLNGVGLLITSTQGGKSNIILPVSESKLRLMSMPRFLLNSQHCSLAFEDSLRLSIDPYSQGLSFEKDTTGRYLNANFPLKILPSHSTGEFVMESFQSDIISREYGLSFDNCVKKQKDAISKWEQSFNYNGKFLNASKKALYINWASFIAPSETMPRYGMLMSKNWMFCTWGWDHCFAALGLRDYQPQLSWDQFMLFFDQQDAIGAIPDYINGKNLLRYITKPPIHGWALSLLMAGNKPLGNDKLMEIYPKLEKWTNFWMFHRVSKNGLPQYFEWYDSGLDNGSVFETGCPVESPDLAAYLVVQMNVLSQLAKELNKPREADSWKNRADELLNKMLGHLYVNGQFVAKRTIDGKWNNRSNSIISYLPLVLGERLPKNIFNKLVEELKSEKSLVSPHGIMTENITSSYYSPDGYWRGPIWPSTSLLVIDGLRRGGEAELANKLAKAYCEMVDKQGFYENFNGETGKGLRDPAYNWTTGVFLHLIQNYKVE